MKVGPFGLFVYTIFFYIGKGIYWIAKKIWYFPNMVRLAIADAAKEDEPDAAKGIYPPKELCVSDIDNPSGLIFGRNVYDHQYLVKPENEDGHAITVGGTGSGKSSCRNIPTLVSWKGRFIAFDLKGELVKKTSWARPSFKVYNPLDPETAGYDPFYLLDKAKNKVQAVRDIVIALIPTPVKQDPVWAEGAQNLLTAGILHFHNQGLDFAQTMLAIRSLPLNRLLEEIDKGNCAEAKIYNSQFLDPDGRRMVTSYYSTMCNAITVFATDHDLRESFNREEMISPADLERGCDLYIHLPEKMLKQWQPVLRLIVGQFMSDLESREESPDNIPILFSIDEMPRFGKIEAITGLATLRSKAVTFDIYIQSNAQLDEIYGEALRKVILDNCDYKCIMRISEPDSQDYYSRAVGDYDKDEVSESENVEGFMQTSASDKMKKRISRSKRETRIIKPNVFADLEVPILLTSKGFMRAIKAPYYENGIFNEKGYSSNKIRQKPIKKEDVAFEKVLEWLTPRRVLGIAIIVTIAIFLINDARR